MTEIRLKQIAVSTVDGFDTVYGLSEEGRLYVRNSDGVWVRQIMAISAKGQQV